MAGLIGDDVLNAFAVVAEPGQVATELVRRFGGLADRLKFYAPYRASARCGTRSGPTSPPSAETHEGQP